MDDDFPLSDAAYDDIFADLDLDTLPPPLSGVPQSNPQSLPSLASLLYHYPAPNQTLNSGNSRIHGQPQHPQTLTAQTNNRLPSLSFQPQGFSPANSHLLQRTPLPGPHLPTQSEPGRYHDNGQSEATHLPPASQALPQPRPPPPSLSFLLSETSSTPNNRGTGSFHNHNPTFGTNLATGSRTPALPVTNHRADREPNSDDFLNELASRDFSSPSLPPQTPRHLNDLLSPSRHTFNTMPVTSAAEGSRRRGRGSSHIIANLPILPPQSSGAPKRKREDGLEGRASKRKAHVLESSDDEKDLFGGCDDLIDMIDLADTEEVPENLRAKLKPKNMVKLSAFQCVICMDNVTNLTVTHCGHLFCSECLHNALTIDPTRRTCPVCRQKIDKAPSANSKWTTKAKGYYPLELKLVTKKSLGKRTAQ